MCRGETPSPTHNPSLFTTATTLLASLLQLLLHMNAAFKATRHLNARIMCWPLRGIPRAISSFWVGRHQRNPPISPTCSPTGQRFMRYRCVCHCHDLPGCFVAVAVMRVYCVYCALVSESTERQEIYREGVTTKTRSIFLPIYLPISSAMSPERSAIHRDIHIKDTKAMDTRALVWICMSHLHLWRTSCSSVTKVRKQILVQFN